MTSRVVWHDGRLVSPETATLSIHDPAVRWGEGLFETMRAEGGRVPLLDRHLARLAASSAALGLAPMPPEARMRSAVGAALAAAGDGPRRVRLSATPGPTLLVEVSPGEPVGAEVAAVSAAALCGTWLSGNRIAEHKCLSYAAHRWSQRRAMAAGADHALLLDADGRLGEAALASVFWAVGGTLATAPARGLLPGIARSLIVDALEVHQRAPAEREWRAADEIVLTNAVLGAVAVVSVDGARVGDGTVGPQARRIARVIRDAFATPPPG